MATWRFPPSTEYGFLELSGASGLRIQLLPDGRLFALRCGEVLINQVLPTPCEAALTRIYLRDRSGGLAAFPLVGPPLAPEGSPAAAFLGAVGERAACWTARCGSLQARVTLQLHGEQAAWVWRVSVRNHGPEPRAIDLLYGQDLGLAPEADVRRNEAYCCQYLDHCAVEDPQFGPVILSRQNQEQGGRHPWLAQGCLEGAAAWSTDGYQFFGNDHRLTGRPACLNQDRLPGVNLQYEFAYPALQSRPLLLEPGAEASVRFFALYRPDHPEASGVQDLEGVREAIAGWPEAAEPPEGPAREPTPTLFEGPWLHGEELPEAEWGDLFPGERRHEERDGAGRLLSFFTEEGRHVVARAKEARVQRPHAHILRTGRSLWLDDETLGATVVMAGAFCAQLYLGNTNLCRFLSVLRNPLSLLRGSGQRVFLREGGGWRQLGVPSAFEMGLYHARWLYRTADGLLEVTTTASQEEPAIDLRVRVLRGSPRSLLVSHQIVMGENEMAEPFTAAFSKSRIECRPDGASLLGRSWPGMRFLVETDDDCIALTGGDELLFADGQTRRGPYVVVVTRETSSLTLRLRGTTGTAPATHEEPDPPQSVGLPRLRHREAAVGRVSDVLPWLAHDAWIHFTAPHGLEQYGGAAWGTRDVCQGPMEWLLATRRFGAARRILLRVFQQQYEDNGNWPQWFMFEPFRGIQAPQSHGDILYWPLKALCDYLEVSGDFGILDEEVPYTDPETFTPTSHHAPLLAHLEKVLDLHEARCLPGTGLVSYGEGDWDDTLQPADPELRTRMVSAWTVGLAYDAFRRYHRVCEQLGQVETAGRLGAVLERMREDFNRWLAPEGVTAGFVVFGGGNPRPLLHPRDELTGIRYRLLPMTRGVLAELFTAEQAREHFRVLSEHLLFRDGVRLMSDPVPYRGGVARWFRRAETAANFGREVGLMYTHAHLRYAEALAKLGDGEGLWRALQVVNPVGLREAVPNAVERQANVYFTSSDGDFADRYEAARRFADLREGRVAVKGGWRLYSSGPGLYLHKVITCLLGLRDSFGDLVIDPVLPASLDGLTAELEWAGHALHIGYRVRDRGFAPARVTVNGHDLPTDRRDPNPYREGGLRVAATTLEALLHEGTNRVEVEQQSGRMKRPAEGLRPSVPPGRAPGSTASASLKARAVGGRAVTPGATRPKDGRRRSRPQADVSYARLGERQSRERGAISCVGPQAVVSYARLGDEAAGGHHLGVRDRVALAEGQHLARSPGV